MALTGDTAGTLLWRIVPLNALPARNNKRAAP